MYNETGGSYLTKLTENTLIPFSLLISLIGFSVGGTWWASALYARVARAEDNISDLQVSHKEIVQELREANFTLIEIKTVLKDNKFLKKEFK